MTDTFNHIHSILRWVALLCMVFAIANAAIRMYRPLLPTGMKWHLFALISMHTQLIVGLILYFTSERMKGFRAAGNVMSNGVSRFYVMEHLVGMVLAIVLVTIGYSKAKRQADDAKRNKTIFWFYLIALFIVIAMIPWPFREVGAGRSWF